MIGSEEIEDKDEMDGVDLVDEVDAEPLLDAEPLPDEETSSDAEPLSDKEASSDAETLLDAEMSQQVLMALLFVSDTPVPMAKIFPVFEAEVSRRAPKKEDAKQAFEARLTREIEEGLKRLTESLNSSDSALQIVEVAGGYQLCTKSDMAVYIERFFERRKKGTLSGASLETLAIIAYKQPMTRAELEALRGVNVDHIVHSLLEKRLIRVAGRKDVPGKPFMYRTTRFFLEYFGLSNLHDLPKADELREAMNRTESNKEPQLFDVPVDDSSWTEPEITSTDAPDQSDQSDMFDVSASITEELDQPLP